MLWPWPKPNRPSVPKRRVAPEKSRTIHHLTQSICTRNRYLGPWHALKLRTVNRALCKDFCIIQQLFEPTQEAAMNITCSPLSCSPCCLATPERLPGWYGSSCCHLSTAMARTQWLPRSSGSEWGLVPHLTGTSKKYTGPFTTNHSFHEAA